MQRVRRGTFGRVARPCIEFYQAVERTLTWLASRLSTVAVTVVIMERISNELLRDNRQEQAVQNAAFRS